MFACHSEVRSAEESLETTGVDVSRSLCSMFTKVNISFAYFICSPLLNMTSYSEEKIKM